MNEIALMLTGQLELSKFIMLLNNNSEIQNAMKALVPPEAINNQESDLWKEISFETFKKYDFDLLALLMQMCRFDGTIPDNLNIFAAIRRVYCFSHPSIVCTKRYEEMHCLYLDVIKDCFDGPDVRHLVYSIVQSAFSLNSKKRRLEQANLDIKKYFHITDNKRPRWISGPEWPMGVVSPMRFLSQKRCRESVKYQFEDVDTGALKTVEQYY